MIGFLKLFCDISVYYALIMYLCRLIMSVDFFAPGYLSLILMVLLVSLRQSFYEEKPAADIPLFFLPALSLFFHPSSVQALLIIPVWGWCVFSCLRQAYDFSYYEFLQLCRNEMIVLFLIYLCLFFLPSFKEAITGVIPYFALLIAGMICMLRYLREDKSGGPVSISLCAGVLSVSFLAAFTNVFGFAGRFVKALYLWIVSLMFKVVTPENLSFLDHFDPPQAGDLDVGGMAYESEGVQEISIPAMAKEMTVFEKILIILLIAALVLIISAILFHAVKGRRFYRREGEKEITEKIPVKKKRRIALFAPNDPREAVRWYYARYVREAMKKGLVLSPAATSLDIMTDTNTVFDEKENEAFRQLYIKARYSSEHITRQEAEAAKECWRAFRSAMQAAGRK